MKCAIIKSGKVINIAEADAAFAKEQGWVELVGEAAIGWRFQNGQLIPPVEPNPTIAERKQGALSALAARRYETETGGIDVGGVSIRTDEVGQGKITGALALFQNDPELVSLDWEAQPGVWATIDQQTLQSIGVTVGRHVQACFSRARVISEAIQAAHTHAAMDVAEAEIEQGWPE